MTEIAAIAAIGSSAESHAAPATALLAPANGSLSFGDMLANGLQSVEDKIDHANELVRAFAVDESVPIHQVTIALEEARLAVDLAVQVRTRLVEGYREIMNMQL